jgi:hypothetical protein
MAITESSIIQVGTRVKIRRGPFPADPSLIGRSGTVVYNSQYLPQKVDVTLDGEDRIRTFAPGELDVEEGTLTLPPDQTAAMKRLSRP